MMTLKCPYCGKDTVQITSDTDWDSLVTYYYGKCSNCGYATIDSYESIGELECAIENQIIEFDRTIGILKGDTVE